MSGPRTHETSTTLASAPPTRRRKRTSGTSTTATMACIWTTRVATRGRECPATAGGRATVINSLIYCATKHSGSDLVVPCNVQFSEAVYADKHHRTSCTSCVHASQVVFKRISVRLYTVHLVCRHLSSSLHYAACVHASQVVFKTDVFDYTHGFMSSVHTHSCVISDIGTCHVWPYSQSVSTRCILCATSQSVFTWCSLCARISFRL